MLGKYKFKENEHLWVRVGLSGFNCLPGHTISVTQIDSKNSKILIDFGAGLIDWFHNSYLNQFEKIS